MKKTDITQITENKTKPISYLEISKSALLHNIDYFKNILPLDTSIIAVVKANAYGHGANIVAPIIEHCVDGFQVEDIEELRLVSKLTNKQIFVLGYVSPLDIYEVIELNATVAILDLEHATQFLHQSKEHKARLKVILAFDSHFGREGMRLEEFQKCLDFISLNERFFDLVGTYAHFSSIDEDPQYQRTVDQVTYFQAAVRVLNELKNPNTGKYIHISNSAGALRYERYLSRHKFVRLGLGIYGIDPRTNSKDFFNTTIGLLPALKWVSQVTQVKVIPEGETIGYGQTYKTKRDTRVALIPQGYADGLDRRLSSIGEVLIHGSRCKILGRVSMNMCVVDVTHLSNLNLGLKYSEVKYSEVKRGDEVVIIGTQGEGSISAPEHAQWINTIPYEPLARLPASVTRICSE